MQVAGSTICILLSRYAAANGLSAACPLHHFAAAGNHLKPAAGCPPDGSEVEDTNVVRREGLSNEPSLSLCRFGPHTPFFHTTRDTPPVCPLQLPPCCTSELPRTTD